MGNNIKENSTNQSNKKLLSNRCNVNDVLSVIGKRWLMNILYEISLGNNQFSKLAQSIPEISEHMLGLRISILTEYNLIQKNEKSNTVPLQVVYILTDKGKELLSLIDGLRQWNDFWND